jgi:hypothetical protein
VEEAVDDVGFVCEEFVRATGVDAVEGGFAEGGGLPAAQSPSRIHIYRHDGCVVDLLVVDLQRRDFIKNDGFVVNRFIADFLVMNDIIPDRFEPD